MGCKQSSTAKVDEPVAAPPSPKVINPEPQEGVEQALKATSSFKVIVDKTAEESVGVRFKKTPFSYVIVEEVMPDGVVATWNSKNENKPYEQILVGDHILDVDGVNGSYEEIEQALTKVGVIVINVAHAKDFLQTVPPPTSEIPKADDPAPVAAPAPAESDLVETAPDGVSAPATATAPVEPQPAEGSFVELADPPAEGASLTDSPTGEPAGTASVKAVTLDPIGDVPLQPEEFGNEEEEPPKCCGCC